MKIPISTWTTIVARAIQQVAAVVILAPLLRLVPKNPHLWLFGSWEGVRYADNPRALFRSNQLPPQVHAVWLTRRRDVRDRVRKEGATAHIWWHPRGIHVLMRAGVWLFSHASTDIGPVPPRKALTVYLTHGTPLKRIISDAAVSSLPGAVGRLANSWRRRWLSPDLTCCASTSARDRFASALTVPRDKIAITGYPRWEPFFARQAAEDRARAVAPVGLHNEAARLLYAPTQRRFGLGEYEPFQLAGAREFAEYCSEAGIGLYYRSHYAQKATNLLPQGWQLLDAEAVDDINDVLPHFDILVTDYSSIFYDFALFRDRLAFLAPDLAEYVARDQGLYVAEYELEVPGPVVHDWFGLMDWLKRGEPSGAHALRSLREASEGVADGRASERIVSLILSQQHNRARRA